jgi:hypothetical protein
MKKPTATLICFILFIILQAPLDSPSSATAVPSLTITAPSQVNESSSFTVTVTSKNVSVANATVMFNGVSNLTNKTGKITFQAVRVSSIGNHTFTITATKDGYTSANTTINILNVPQLLPSVASNYITENTAFLLTVFDDEGRNIRNVTVTYQNKGYKTDSNGTVLLLTPPVRKSETYRISAAKPGYLSNYIPIVVSPRPSQENLLGILILVGVCFVTVVVSISLVIGQIIKRRRINRR